MKKVQMLTLQSQPRPQECELLREISVHLFGNASAPVVSPTADALLENLAALLRRSNVFIIAAEPAQYLKLKAKLIKGLGYASHVRSHILNHSKNTTSEYPTHEDAAFPIGAATFLSDGGQLNGFALHCGKQDILMLPLSLSLLKQQHEQIIEYFLRRERNTDPSKNVEQMLNKLSHGAQFNDPIRPESLVPFTPSPKPELAKIIPLSSTRKKGKSYVRRSVAAGATALMLFSSVFTAQAANKSAITPSSVATEQLQFVTPFSTEAPLSDSPLTSVPTSALDISETFGSLGGVGLVYNALSFTLQLAYQVVTHAPDITTPPTTQPPVSSTPPASTGGTFKIQVAGFGHGVGMSQMGAIELARRGWNAEQILLHYYHAPGVTISTDRNPPTHVNHGDRWFPLHEYIARITYREIGTPNNVPREAMIAQMITAYSIAKRNQFRTTEVNQHILSDADWNSDWARQFHEPMLAMAREVAGRYVSFNGRVANTLYFASSAGRTASAQWAWSGNYLPSPYLTGGRYSPEAVDRSAIQLTTEQIRRKVNDYNARFPNNRITLCNNPAQWIRVLNHCPAGYVERIQIGNRILTGGNARMHFFGARVVRAHAFTVNFTAES